MPLPERHVDILERIRILRELRIHLEHHVVLVQLREDGGHLALPKGVVQRVVDRLRQNPQSRSGIAIDHQLGLEAAILLVGGHVAHGGQLAQFVHQFGRPDRQLLRVRAFHRILILRPAHPVFHRQVLHRLHVQRDAARPCASSGCRRRMISLARGFAFVARLQIDLNAAAVGSRVGAVNSDEGRKTLHIGILQNHASPAPVAASTSRRTKCSAALPKRPESRPYPAPGKNLWARPRTARASAPACPTVTSRVVVWCSQNKFQRASVKLDDPVVETFP